MPQGLWRLGFQVQSRLLEALLFPCFEGSSWRFMKKIGVFIEKSQVVQRFLWLVVLQGEKHKQAVNSSKPEALCLHRGWIFLQEPTEDAARVSWLATLLVER